MPAIAYLIVTGPMPQALHATDAFMKLAMERARVMLEDGEVLSQGKGRLALAFDDLDSDEDANATAQSLIDQLPNAGAYIKLDPNPPA